MSIDDEDTLGFVSSSIIGQRLEKMAARALVATGPTPKHIAFCMDGNRRFAKKMGLDEGGGHVAGFEAMLRLLLACYHLHVSTVTVYAFSIENFNRRPEESENLFNIVRTKLWDMAANKDGVIRRFGWRVRFLGHRSMLDADLVSKMEEIEAASAEGQEMQFNICAPYTTRDDIAQALAAAVKSSSALETSSSPSSAVFRIFENARYMAESEQLDLLVRTSGETRFSDFMVWEANSSCSLEFVPQLWPEFSVWHLYRLVAKWQHRRRRESRRQTHLGSLSPAPPLASVTQKQQGSRLAQLPEQKCAPRAK